jgi:hypothetical protein
MRRRRVCAPARDLSLFNANASSQGLRPCSGFKSVQRKCVVAGSAPLLGICSNVADFFRIGVKYSSRPVAGQAANSVGG